ncbi:MAG: leucine-rich repeat protein, partial [Clostridia bacterium]|nr:leucine-rich repeat protein [Clostridia bacterium]
MKKKIILLLTLALMLSLMLVVSVSAEVTIYDDAPERTKYQCYDDEIIEFYDGFKCPVSYVFTDTSTVGTGDYNTKFEYFMDFTYINGKLGKTEEAGNLYTYADVKGFDIPTGITHVAKYAGANNATLKWITFPNTVSGLSNAVFQNATALEYCVMEFAEDNPLRVFPSYMFTGCANLKAFSMPDCFTSIYDRYTFTNCKNMTAVYLSKNLTTWSSGGGGSGGGTFDYCNNMYFVNEPFVGENIPEKPEIYYFPANLQNTDASSDFSKNSTMRDCYALNDVLVFGTKVTSMLNEYFFQNGPQNKVVFLGNMIEVRTGRYWGTTTFYFANPADKSLEDLTFTIYNNGAKTTYFCNAEGNTNHLAERVLDVEAKCEVDAGKVTYCFCGYEMSKEAVEGTALSHDYDYLNNEKAELISFVYTNYS